MRHFLALKDFTKAEILEILELAARIKNARKAGEKTLYLEGKTLGMIFEKSSTRTRVSFEVGMYQLGGSALFLSSRDIQLGRGEPMKDTARVLSRMVDMVMIRTGAHSGLEEFADYSAVPVINGLTDDFHPVQLMADMLTMQECGLDERASVAYIGDGNNMANSWLILAAKLGMDIRIATPKGYEVQPEIISLAEGFAKESGARLLFTHDPVQAVTDTDVVATDVWASMGQEDEQQKRLRDFQGFMVDTKLLSHAQKSVRLFHCLPAHRGEEVSEEAFETHADTIFLEAENRLHAQKGIMVWLERHR